MPVTRNQYHPKTFLKIQPEEIFNQLVLTISYDYSRNVTVMF